MTIDFRSLTRSELETWATEQALPAFRGRQLFRRLWRPGFSDFDEMTDLSRDLREEIASQGLLTRLSLATERCSVDGTRKFAWRLPDGMVIESVLIPERDHWTLCLSTQVGCAMGCAFCHTARMGFHRQLPPSEIAGQVLAAVEHTGERERLRNLVFMGMGEPLANYDNVMKALAILTDDLGLNFSVRRITLSTCGLIPQMLRLGEESDVGLAISLHAPNDEIRTRLMPINRRYPLADLIEASLRYRLPRRRRITFEYMLIAGINDSLEHAKALARLLRAIPAKVNLIPFNEGPGLPLKRSADAQILAFQKVLTDAQYTAIIRKSKGVDIAAACGQLCAELRSLRAA